MADEIQRLIMQVVNAEKIEELTAKLETQETTLRNLTQQAIAAGQGIAQIAASPQAQASATKIVGLKDEIRKLENQTRNLGPAALTASNAFQDLVQGGFGGVLNNLPQLVTQLGGKAGLAGAIGAVGVAIYLLKDPFLELIEWATSGSIQIPKVHDALKDMDDELKTTKQRLADLGDGYGLTIDELTEYQRLSGEVLKLERDRNAEAERRVGLEKARREQEQGGLDKEAAEVAKAAMDELGGVDDTVNAVRNAMTAESEKLKAAHKAVNDASDALAKTQQDEPFNVLKIGLRMAELGNAKQQRNAITKGLENSSQDLVLRARNGDPAAIAELARLVPGGAFGQATPAGMAASDTEAADLLASTERTPAEKAARKARGERQAEEDRDEANKAREERRQQEREAGQMDRAAREAAAVVAPLEAAQARPQIDAELQAQERALNGGFTGAESQQIASGNLALSAADRGQATPDQLQKIIQQNQAMMNSLEGSGADGGAAMSAFMQQQQQLMWALGQLREVQMQQQQWRQMQQTSGTLLSRGRG